MKAFYISLIVLIFVMIETNWDFVNSTLRVLPGQ